MRWLTTLFAREFSLQNTFRVWDALLAHPDRFQLMYCIGTSMIQKKEEFLLASDFAGIMQCLQNYECDDVEGVIHEANRVRNRVLKGNEVEETSRSKGKSGGNC